VDDVAAAGEVEAAGAEAVVGVAVAAEAEAGVVAADSPEVGDSPAAEVQADHGNDA